MLSGLDPERCQRTLSNHILAIITFGVTPTEEVWVWRLVFLNSNQTVGTDNNQLRKGLLEHTDWDDKLLNLWLAFRRHVCLHQTHSGQSLCCVLMRTGRTDDLKPERCCPRLPPARRSENAERTLIKWLSEKSKNPENVFLITKLPVIHSNSLICFFAVVALQKVNVMTNTSVFEVKILNNHISPQNEFLWNKSIKMSFFINTSEFLSCEKRAECCFTLSTCCLSKHSDVIWVQLLCCLSSLMASHPHHSPAHPSSYLISI